MIRMRTLTVALAWLACLSPLVAQSPDSDDFKVQGEYVGSALGLQVVAKGDGGFDMALYAGGLPGAGWDRTPPQRAEGGQGCRAVGPIADAEEDRTAQSDARSEAPADAVVLFDGTQASLSKWQNGAKRTDDGLLMPGVTTRDTFRDYTLHVEFHSFHATAAGQARGNRAFIIKAATKRRFLIRSDSKARTTKRAASMKSAIPTSTFVFHRSVGRSTMWTLRRRVSMPRARD